MTIVEQENENNNETTLLLDENINNDQYTKNENQNNFNSNLIKKWKYLTIFVVIIIGAFILKTSLFNNNNNNNNNENNTQIDPKVVQLNNLNYINSIKIEEASRTHLVDEKKSALTNNTKSKPPVDIVGNDKPSKNYTEEERNKKIFKDEIFKTYKNFNFYFVNGTEGPITLDLNNDDGSKVNLYSRMINKNKNKFVVYNINKEKFKKLPDRKPSYQSIFCEIPQTAAPESITGYKISCPLYYVLNIEEAFYGLHNQNDKICELGKYIGPEKNKEKRENNKGKAFNKKEFENSRNEISLTKRTKNNNSTDVNSNSTDVNNNSGDANLTSVISSVPIATNPTNEWHCDSYPTKILKDKCDEKRSCYIKPIRSFFGIPCAQDNKYLELKYHCEKREVKQPRIAIITFSNGIGINSIYENAISELYQYAKIHNYDLYVDNKVYDNEREIYYMKTNTIIKYLIKFLEEKTYDWIFWVDSDISIVNPNIKLESFLPPLNKPDLHLIISKDSNGLNAGIFFLRVHPWSLNYMMRSSSYTYYNRPSLLFFSDQASMNNVLVESEGRENEHFAIVPQNWFNMYIMTAAEGYLLIHFAGVIGKDDRARALREFLAQSPNFYKKTAKEMRKEVLEFYKTPIDNSLNLHI